MRSVASLLLVILLASCATPYQATGLAGGYSDAQLDKNVFRVTFQGNGFTEPQRAADFTLMRSAELTLKAGFTHFAIVSGASRTDYTTHTTPRQATTTGTATAVGNTAYVTANTTYSGGQTFLIAAPSTTNIHLLGTAFLTEKDQRPTGASLGNHPALGHATNAGSTVEPDPMIHCTE